MKIKLPLYIFLLLILLLGNPFFLSAQNEARIDSLLNILKNLSEEDSIGKVDILNSIALEFTEFQPDKSLEYAEEAQKIAGILQYKQGLATSLRYIGISYQNKNDLNNALKYFFISLAKEEELNNDEGRAACLYSIANTYKKREVYNEAIRKYVKAVEVYEKLGNKEGTAQALNELAETYLKIANYNNAIDFAEKSIQIAQQNKLKNAFRIIMIAHSVLSKVYAKKEEFEKAYAHQIVYNSMKDSVFKETQITEVNKIENRFNSEKKKREEEEKAKNAKIQASNLQYLIILLIFLASFAVISFFGILKISTSISKTFIFISLFSVAQFFLLLTKPTIELYTGGLPLFTLLINTFFAYCFIRLVRFLESKIKDTIIKEVPSDATEERRRENFTQVGDLKLDGETKK